MAYASVTYTSASGTTFALTNSSGDPIQYIKQSDIAVYVNNTLQTLTTDYTFNSAGTAIVLNVAVSGATVLIQRTTDIGSPTVIYTAGSTLTAQDLNNADNQLRYGLQEFRDFVNTGGGVPDGDRGDITVAGNGTIWTIDNGVVNSAKIANDTIVNADINSAAAIAHSKLANITAGQVLLGNSSNVPTATALTGDVTINSSGVTAIGSGVVVNADINASAAIAGTKIQAATTSNAGAVQLTDSISSTSTTTAATPNSVKTSYDLANAAMPKSGGTFTGDITSTTVKVTNLQHASAASPAIVLASDGTATAQLSSLNGGALSGARNRIINGDMRIDQRNAGASQTFTAAAALAYSVDRWYGYCTGANVTGQQIAGATAGQFRYRFTGAASVTAIGFGQRIEQLNSTDLAGTTATLSVDLANSVLTTVTWTAYYATTANSFGTLASPTRTQIATGTFTVNSTVTRYSTNISIPAAATTGIEIVFTVAAQTSGTWTIGDVQLEAGSVATPYERRSYGQELALCQRYYSKSFPAASGFPSAPYYDGSMGWGQSVETAAVQVSVRFPAEMRATPTVTIYSPTSLTAGTFRVWQASVDRNGSAGHIASSGFTRIDKSGAADLAPSATQNSAIHWIATAEL